MKGSTTKDFVASIAAGILSINKELGKIKDSAVKVGLPLKKVSKIINRQGDSCNSKAEMLSHGGNVMSGEVENDISSEVESAPTSVEVTKFFVFLPFITKKLSLVFKSNKILFII